VRTAKFEEIEHTADLGLRIYGATLDELLVNAAEGMFSLIGVATFTAGEVEERRIELQFASREDALYEWLRALLLELELHGLFPTAISLTTSSHHLAAVVSGGRFDPARHQFFTEIKAVTRHGLRVSQNRDGFEAEVIFDV
jgi:SHS2 domain-containing protein